jgi:hypothetical protein
MLSSKDHDDDRDWISIGTGPWDREGRESWVRRDRVLAVPSGSVRREGAILPKATYEAIVSGLDGAAPRSGAPSAPRPPSTAPARATSPGFFGKIAGLFRRKT